MRPNASKRPPSEAHPSVEVHGLEQMLRAQLDLHARLLQCVERKKEAIRTADIKSITAICGQENALLQNVAECEKRRLAEIGRLTRLLDPSARQPLIMSEIAARIAEPQRSCLLALGAQLREAVENLRTQSSIVRAAAEALSVHMNGVVQTVYSALSRARVYGQRGRIAMGAQLQSVVDIKT